MFGQTLGRIQLPSVASPEAAGHAGWPHPRSLGKVGPPGLPTGKVQVPFVSTGSPAGASWRICEYPFPQQTFTPNLHYLEFSFLLLDSPLHYHYKFLHSFSSLVCHRVGFSRLFLVLKWSQIWPTEVPWSLGQPHLCLSTSLLFCIWSSSRLSCYYSPALISHFSRVPWLVPFCGERYV